MHELQMHTRILAMGRCAIAGEILLLRDEEWKTRNIANRITGRINRARGRLINGNYHRQCRSNLYDVYRT